MRHDLFSERAASYARYRPRYPEDLFTYLVSVVPARRVALDCATGNGQAALPLADRFDGVLATDASRHQLLHAQPHPRVRYVVANAEEPPVRSATADLVTVAQGAHWLDLDRFFPAVRRVLRRGGVLAMWTYRRQRLHTAVDDVLAAFYSDRLGRYWLPERRHVEEDYRSIPFPFDELDAPPLHMEVTWSLDDLLGYLETWSAVQQAQRAGEDPVHEIGPTLREAWGNPESRRQLRFEVFMRIGVVERTKGSGGV